MRIRIAVQGLLNVPYVIKLPYSKYQLPFTGLKMGVKVKYKIIKKSEKSSHSCFKNF